MKKFSLVALGAAVTLAGCVAYPVDTYHHRDDRSAYREHDRHYDRDDRHNEWRERDRDHGDNDRDGDRRDWPARP